MPTLCAPCHQGKHADAKNKKCPDARCECPCRILKGKPDVESAVFVLLLANRAGDDLPSFRLATSVVLVALGYPKAKLFPKRKKK